MRCWPRPSNERRRWHPKKLPRDARVARAPMVSEPFEYARAGSYHEAVQARATAWPTLQADGSVLIRCGEGKGPLNVRGTGEPPVGPVASAIASAIADATGCRPTRLPMTAERVLALLDAARPDRP